MVSALFFSPFLHGRLFFFFDVESLAPFDCLWRFSFFCLPVREYPLSHMSQQFNYCEHVHSMRGDQPFSYCESQRSKAKSWTRSQAPTWIYPGLRLMRRIRPGHPFNSTSLVQHLRCPGLQILDNACAPATTTIDSHAMTPCSLQSQRICQCNRTIVATNSDKSQAADPRPPSGLTQEFHILSSWCLTCLSVARVL